MNQNDLSVVQSDKQQLIENIKNWIILDDQLKIINEKSKQ